MRHIPAARIVAAVSAAFWGVLFFGLIDLAVVFLGTPGFYESYLLETGWGLLYSIMVAAPLVALALKPHRTSLIAQIVVVALCITITGIPAFSSGQLFPAACLLFNAIFVNALCGSPLRLSRDGRNVRRRPAPLWPVLIVACIAVPLSIVVAADLVMGFWELRPPIDDDTWSIDHWPMQAALALAVPAVAILASFRLTGWRVSLWTAALSAAWWGAVSIAYPQHAGSLGTVGGWAGIVWAIALLLSSAAPVRHERAVRPHNGHGRQPGA